jgi:peptidoglycan hydrolase-like protein with peptidoglycan-binding domain
MAFHSIIKYNPQFSSITNSSTSLKTSITKSDSAKNSYRDFSNGIAAKTPTDVQNALKNKNNLEIPIDGYLSTDTFKAIKAFQQNNNNNTRSPSVTTEETIASDPITQDKSLIKTRNNSDIIKAIQSKLTYRMNPILVTDKIPRKYELPTPIHPKNEV